MVKFNWYLCDITNLKQGSTVADLLIYLNLTKAMPILLHEVLSQTRINILQLVLQITKLLLLQQINRYINCHLLNNPGKNPFFLKVEESSNEYIFYQVNYLSLKYLVYNRLLFISIKQNIRLYIVGV